MNRQPCARAMHNIVILFHKVGQLIKLPIHTPSNNSDGQYYRKSIEIIDTYKSIDTFDTRKKYR